MNGSAVCASGAGAGSEATEPRSRAPPGLGAQRRFIPSPGRSGAKRSGGPRRGWRTEHVWDNGHTSGGVPLSPLTNLLSWQAERAASFASGGDRDRSGNRSAAEIAAESPARRGRPIFSLNAAAPVSAWQRNRSAPASPVERMGIDELLSDLADSAALMHSVRSARIFIQVEDEHPRPRVEDVVRVRRRRRHSRRPDRCAIPPQ